MSSRQVTSDRGYLVKSFSISHALGYHFYSRVGHAYYFLVYFPLLTYRVVRLVVLVYYHYDSIAYLNVVLGHVDGSR